MEIICEPLKCFGCMACMNICPKSCIVAETDENGFLYPAIDQTRCINCKCCVNICPVNHSARLNDKSEVYAAQLKDGLLCKKSTSGGLFQALASFILRQNGYVCASKRHLDNTLEHSIFSRLDDLEAYLKSKYYQSYIGLSFRDIKKKLQQNEVVLFCGTPCQVAGLYGYLGRNYDSLYTCDLICHGVPSKKIVDKYIEQKELFYKSQLKSISFRDKSEGWENMRITLEFENGKSYSRIATYDDFYFGFFRGLYYRKCCYSCPFATTKRIGDISLGDFWGIENTKSKMDPKKGISLCLINTEKGERLFSKIKEQVDFEEHTMAEAAKVNHNLKAPSRMNPSQDKFYTYLDYYSFRKALIKTLTLPYIKNNIKRILHFHL